MDTPTVIIIDDLADNGLALIKAGIDKLKVADRIHWIRYSDNLTSSMVNSIPSSHPDYSSELLANLKQGSNFHPTTNKGKVIELLSNQNSALIILYDLQLGIGSHPDITEKLKNMVDESKANKRPCVYVLVYSSELRAIKVAKEIDPNGVYAKPTGFQFDSSFDYQDIARDLINEALKGWSEACADKGGLALGQFLIEAELLSHRDIQNNLEGKAVQLLKRFLRIPEQDFFERFCFELDTKTALKPEVADALKNLSGLSEETRQESSDEPEYIGRRMRYNGAWIIALGQFLNLFPYHGGWDKIFIVDELTQPRFPTIHPKQKNKEIRRRTLLSFGKMCEVLFRDRNDETRPVLERVSLSQKRLSFILDFPAEGLLGNIMNEARAARQIEAIADFTPGHDCSQAIWQFWVSSSFTDLYVDEKTGVFESPLMNVFTLGEKTKTEVRFGS